MNVKIAGLRWWMFRAHLALWLFAMVSVIAPFETEIEMQ